MENALVSRLLLTAMTLILLGCDRPSVTKNDTSDAPWSSGGTKSLEAQVRDLEIENMDLKSRIENLESAKAFLTGQPTYSIARNQFGSFPIVPSGAIPFLDGHKLTLKVGNPTLFTFRGAEITIIYGPPMPKLPDGNIDWSKYRDYQSKRRTYKSSSTAIFRPGWYTDIEVTITPSKAEEVRELEVGIDFRALSLQDRQ